jgi:hypothetical protein
MSCRDRYQFQARRTNVQGGVEVSIMDCSTATKPYSVGQRQLRVDAAADVARFGRGEPTVNDRQVPSVPNRFIVQLPAEHSESSIEN